MSKKSPFSPWSSPDPTSSDADTSSSSESSADLSAAAADLSAAAAELQSFAQELGTASSTSISSNPINVTVTVTDAQGDLLPSSTETDGPDLSLLS